MADVTSFISLPARQRAIVAIAVLLDGLEAVDYLQNDPEYGAGLVRASSDLVKLAPDLRLPFVGTLLRRALDEVASSTK